MSIEAKIKAAVRDVPDFPKPGILFKDITPIFENQALCNDIVQGFINMMSEKPDAIIREESRGFLFGLLIGKKLKFKEISESRFSRRYTHPCRKAHLPDRCRNP